MSKESPPSDATRRRGPGVVSFLLAFLGTGLAAVFALLNGIFQANAGFAPEGGESGFVLGRTVAGLLGCIVFAGFIGLVAGGIAVLLKNSFLKAAIRTYSAFIVIAALFLILAGLLRVGGGVSNDRQVLAEIQGEMGKLAEARKAADASGSRIAIQFDASQPASTDMGRLRNAFFEFLNRTISVENHYQEELESIGMGEFLTPSVLEGDRDFKKSRATLDKAKAAAETFRSETKAAMDDLKSLFDTLEFQGKESRKFSEDFRVGMGDYFRNTLEVLDLESKKLYHYEEAFHLLEAGRDTWHIGENKILFKNDGNLEAYRELIEEINNCVNRQNEIRSPGAAPAG